MKSTILVVFVCFLGCQPGLNERNTRADNQRDLSYHPESGMLRIVSNVANPEVTKVKLLNDKKEDSLAVVNPRQGQFALVVDLLPMQEVYFLEISGRSIRKGTAGLEWTEYVPVYLEESNANLVLDYVFFNHPGSISQAKFSIGGGSDEQELLNKWQEALNVQTAEIEGQTVQYTFGASGFSKEGSAMDAHTVKDSGVTQRFIQQKAPLVASLFLVYTTNDHRKQAAAYNQLYEAVPDYARQTKYGIDLIRRLDRIKDPVKKLDLESQVVVVGPGLNRLSWSDFTAYENILLCFWDSMDQTAYAEIKDLEEQIDTLNQQRTALVHVAMDDRFSQWKKNTGSFDLAYNYKLRNEVKQPLVEALYLTDLPRYLLARPDGEVIDADVSPETLRTLLR